MRCPGGGARAEHPLYRPQETDLTYLLTAREQQCITTLDARYMDYYGDSPRWTQTWSTSSGTTHRGPFAGRLRQGSCPPSGAASRVPRCSRPCVGDG